MDALSEVLGAVRLTGAVFLDMELRARWSYLTASIIRIATDVGYESEAVFSGAFNRGVRIAARDL